MRVIAPLMLALCWIAPLGAHDGADGVIAGPSGWDLAVLALLGTMAVLYAKGSARLAARGARVRRAERVAFWSGWVILAVAVAPPMDRAAAAMFSMHMVQHELLMRIGVPLLIVGRPLVPWLWALPDGIRAHAGAGLPQRSVSELWRWLTTPAIAWALHGVTIWVWHLPALYEAAVRSEAVHALQHAMFVGTAVIFWWGVMYGRYGRLAYGAAALFLFTTMVHTGVLGAMFALSTAPFYGVYRDRAAALGIDAAADQQLAGLYMWIPAGVVLTVCGLAMVVAWLAEAERRARARARTTMLALIVVAAACVGGCSSMPHEQEVRALTGGDPFRGRELIRQYGCDSCHTIPGVHGADANVGPPLVNVARRLYLAGHIQNTPENMMRWIQHPRALDPKTAMPEMGVTGSDSRDITAYLYTLR